MLFMIIFTQIKAVFIALFLFAFVLMPTCLVAIFLPLKRRLLVVCPVWRFVCDKTLRWVCAAKIDISEDHRSDELKNDLPAKGLYIANHQSYIDIPLIITKFQVPPIMKKEVLYIPIIGLVGWASGALIVSRGKNDSRRRVFEQTKRRILKEKIGIQYYPEGTRSKLAHPKPDSEIKKTLIYFAFDSKIPVIPVSMYGTRSVLTKMGTIRPNRHLGVIVHKEIHPDGFANREEFAKACWDKVLVGYDQMRTKLHPLNN